MRRRARATAPTSPSAAPSARQISGRAEFGRIALGLGDRQPETEFQVGLRRFSMLLLQVAVALTVLILVANLALHRPLLDSVLFSLAIAVGSPLSCSRPSSAAASPPAPGR